MTQGGQTFLVRLQTALDAYAKFILGGSMLLRRISRHVNEQNWIAVCLDVAIVFVGVFIGAVTFTGLLVISRILSICRCSKLASCGALGSL